MTRCISLILALGIGSQALADVNSVDRSKRTFRKDASTGVVYADLVVAYQDAPAFVLTKLGSKTTKAFIEETMVQASLDLFTASKGAVQLGKITVIPASTISGGALKADPDLVIMADPDNTHCPANTLRAEEPTVAGGVPVCADANTGGYLGLAWWRAADLRLGATQPVFYQKFATGEAVSSVGSRVSVSWNTLATQGSKVLVHEFGHYLFGMRDEYEGPIFPSYDDYENATALVPNASSGLALSGSETGVPDNWYFTGYGMGLVSQYSAAKGYSLKALPAVFDPANTGASPGWPAFPGAMDEKYVVTEQIANIAARGESNAPRGGGMWSLETAIRTSLNAAYTPVVLPASAHNTSTEAIVDFYGAGQANVFVVDRSGSMLLNINGTTTGVTRWDAALDFFGRMTHPEATGTSVAFPANARFGLVGFDTDLLDYVTYPATYSSLKDFTVPYSAGSGANKGLAWMSSTPSSATYLPPPVDMSHMTNLVGALGVAQSHLDLDPLRPFQRNVILISDGMHNTPNPADFTGDEGLNGKYRVFAVSVDAKLDGSDQYGTKMQNLATRSIGPEGIHGKAYFTNGENTGLLAGYANNISNEINMMENATFSPSQLFKDAAREFSLTTDASQQTAQFAMSWVGTSGLTLGLVLSNGQTITEANATGITFRQGQNFKAYDIDLTKYPAGTWKLRVSTTAALPITIFPTAATKSSNLKVNVAFDPTFATAAGRLPVTVTVQDGRPIEGLQVTASLTNRATGVRKVFALNWNGSSYTGALVNNLQPGLNDLAVSVVHPNNGKVYYGQGENKLPAALRSQYPYFQAREQSQQVWVGGASAPKTLPGLEAWTIQEEPSFAQGTRFKLFLKNGTSVPLTGLRARYFYSVTEYPNGVPAVSINYLAGNSKVSVGSVTNRPGLSYVEFDFAGKTLNPGQSSSNGTNGGEGLYVIESQWRTPWNATNDWSSQGLKPTWSVNSFVNIYDATGKLLSGNPDLENTDQSLNSSPIVNLSVPQLVSVGTPANFLASAVDPDGDYLTYKWTVNGNVVTGVGGNLVYTFPSAGTYSVAIEVADGISPATKVVTNVVVQDANGACSDANSRDLGLPSAGQPVSVVAGTNCFVVKASNMNREWNWTKVLFQANSDNGVVLTGMSVAEVNSTSWTALSGYTQTVPFNDPGRSKNLYIKLQAPGSRTTRLVWWLQ